MLAGIQEQHVSFVYREVNLKSHFFSSPINILPATLMFTSSKNLMLSQFSLNVCQLTRIITQPIIIQWQNNMYDIK